MFFVHYLSGDNGGWQGQEKCILNDPNVYVSPGDKYASKVLKEVITVAPEDGANPRYVYFDPYGGIQNDITGSGAISFSYCLICGFSSLPSTSLATVPLAFTRGLKANGKWHSKYGLYGDKGGYVVFCDGHVSWFDGGKPAKFLKWNQSGYSTDIRDAVPNSAFISSGYVVKNNIQDTDGSLMITQHYGTGGE
jgi:prepilin-type processing-associated H-X9-DG protein